MISHGSLTSCRRTLLVPSALFAACFSLLACAASGQDQASGAPPVQTDRWEMEQIHRKGKEPLHGLVLRKQKDEIEFIEIVRPKGKPLYLVVHHLRPGDVEKIVNLKRPQRQKLFDRIVPLLALKSRIQIEQLRMEDVGLKEVVRDGKLWWLFENPLVQPGKHCR